VRYRPGPDSRRRARAVSTRVAPTVWGSQRGYAANGLSGVLGRPNGARALDGGDVSRAATLAVSHGAPRRWSTSGSPSALKMSDRLWVPSAAGNRIALRASARPPGAVADRAAQHTDMDRPARVGSECERVLKRMDFGLHSLGAPPPGTSSAVFRYLRRRTLGLAVLAYGVLRCAGNSLGTGWQRRRERAVHQGSGGGEDLAQQRPGDTARPGRPRSSTMRVRGTGQVPMDEATAASTTLPIASRYHTNPRRRPTTTSHTGYNAVRCCR